MSNLFLTLIIAFVIIVLAIASLAIGWLVTGKTKIEKKSCEGEPGLKQGECDGATPSCSLCETDDKKKDKKS